MMKHDEGEFDRLCSDLIEALQAFESLQRRFDPGIIPHLCDEIRPVAEQLEHALDRVPPAAPDSAREALRNAAELTVTSLQLFITSAGFEESLIAVRKAQRKIGRAQEVLYPVRHTFPVVDRFFIEPPMSGRIDNRDPGAHSNDDVGLMHVGMDDHPYARGSFSLYVPESYHNSESFPLVVALHGGWGHGRDFLWLWLREARSRRFLLLSPSSQRITWSITGPDVDAEALAGMLHYIMKRWNINSNRILLTGLSDGATYALKHCQQETSPFTGFAPVAGVLPPYDLRGAKNRRIFWVHGYYDWMFPVKRAEQDANILKLSGADVTLRVIEDLSHTYPRELNDAILTWFDPTLSLPAYQSSM